MLSYNCGKKERKELVPKEVKPCNTSAQHEFFINKPKALLNKNQQFDQNP